MLEQAEKYFALRRSVRNHGRSCCQFERIVWQRCNLRSILRRAKAAKEQEKRDKLRGPDGHNALSSGQGTIVSRKRNRRNASPEFAANSPEADLFAGEVVHCDRILEQGIVSGYDTDTALGNEVALTIGLGVIAD